MDLAGRTKSETSVLKELDINPNCELDINFEDLKVIKYKVQTGIVLLFIVGRTGRARLYETK